MIIVVDANILISAIINPDSFIGITLLTQNNNVDYVLPSFAIEETLIHRERICKTLQIEKSFFDNNLNAVHNACLVFASESILPKYSKVAIQIVEKINPKEPSILPFLLH